MLYILLLSLVLLSTDLVQGVLHGRIKNLVTFGDSYTDTVLVPSGGTQWPTYVSGYTGVNLFPFARSGGTCSITITPRPYPSVFESQLPAYFNQTGANPATHNPGTLNPDRTIYTLWIGTNDVGANALLTENKGDLVAVARCMVNWVKVLYQAGARNFLFQNMIPLETTPLYSADPYISRYWTAPRNTTEWNLFIKELSLSGNELTRLMLRDLVPTLPGAHIGIFDSHSLFADIYSRPQLYLNGTAPLNVTGAARACILQPGESQTAPGNCTIAEGTDKDSFLWFDELHPSEQASRVVARQIADVIQGKKNKWTTWLS